MISTKKHIQQLAAILLSRGFDDIIVSPGSRNGPLIHTFAGSGLFNCRNIVDERSASYFALGLAQNKQKPVVLICSSGTAPLNYAPAVAEAFYLGIPLIVLTADRPPYWIDQAENQCIKQENIYRDFSKKEVSLPLGESPEELWFAGRLINECINIAASGNPGPVHINIPLEEPLHDLLEADLPQVKIIEAIRTQSLLTDGEPDKLASTFNQTGKVLIIAGQQLPDPKLEYLLAWFVDKTGAVVLKEHLSNLDHPLFSGNIDLLMTAVDNDQAEDFRPELVISFGGHIVSNSLKQFLRKHKPLHHWHLSLAQNHADTWQALTVVIGQEPACFFKQLSDQALAKDKTWLKRWKQKESFVNQRRDEFLRDIEFCDLKVFDCLRKSIPENSVVHLGNSSPVRYALLHDAVPGALYLGNRGTSGIDGSLSTTVGFAVESRKLNTIILGDLSFFYDSNALWNKYVGNNLRVIVINNGGGNIFGMIKGPEKSPAFKEHFLAENKFSAEGIAKTFGLGYFRAENENELKQGLHGLYSTSIKRAALMEIFTDGPVNSRLFRELFKQL